MEIIQIYCYYTLMEKYCRTHKYIGQLITSEMKIFLGNEENVGMDEVTMQISAQTKDRQLVLKFYCRIFVSWWNECIKEHIQ